MIDFPACGFAREEVESRKGLVVAKHPIAAQVGAQVLDEGGNAVDAAIATAFAVGIVEPYMSGIGGVGIALWWDGQRVHQIDGYTRVPQRLDPDYFPLIDGSDRGLFGWQRVKEDRNLYGPASVAVPSMPALLERLYQLGGKLPWNRLVAPAVQLAREGWKADWLTVLNIVESQEILERYPYTAAVFLPAGRVPKADLSEQGGWRFVQPDLAKTLQTLADEGTAPFYRGHIAKKITDFIRQAGGFLSEDDLSSYEVRVTEPLVVQLSDSLVWLPSGLNGGPTVAETLNLMAQSEHLSEQWGSAELLEDWVVAGLTAFDDRFTFLGDHAESPPLWGKEYARHKKLGWSRDHHFRSLDSTTHVAVVDGQGHGVSLTLTLLGRWGSHVIVPDVGILLNNGIMWCDPRPGRPNSLAPGAVPLANMAPVLVTKDDALQGLIGSSGGRRIIPANAQILVNLLVHLFSPQAAVSAPRVDFSGLPVLVDMRFSPEAVGLLKKRLPVPIKLVVPVLGGATFASPLVIWGEPGTWKAGLDPMVPASAVATAQ